MQLFADQLDSLYQDEHLLVVDKPPGLLVHPSWLDKGATDTLVGRVRQQFGPGWQPVHRLDRPTSGLLLLAKGADVTRQLQAQWPQVQKQYWLVARGHVPASGFIDHALVPRMDDIADQGLAAKPAQDAQTRFRCLRQCSLPMAVGRYTEARYSLVEAEPITGRKHQIRRHMKHIFHPILGDTTYGEGRHNRLLREHFSCSQLLLRARQLRFTHPVSQQSLTVTAPLTEMWQQVLAAMGLQPEA